jgi:uncharacterized membrane protein YgcG
MLVVTNVRTSATLEADITVDSLRLQDAGSREAASVPLELHDPTLAFDLLPEDEITISSVSSPSDLIFGGNVRSLNTIIEAIGRTYSLTAYDYSTLLDRVNVVQDDLPAHNTDEQDLAYLMTTYGGAVGLSGSNAHIATLNADMPLIKLRLLTLRQAIETVLGTALVTGDYRMRADKMLETWDTNPGLAAAPYAVVVGAPGGGQIAPDNLQVQTDTSNLFNAYWVRGSTAAGSGWFVDAASVAQWGRREKYIDAPDSDLSWKAFNVGTGALVDTKEPKYRGSFRAYDGDWRSNQRFALTSPMHGFAAAPFDTVRVTRVYLDGTAREAFDIEFGSPKGSFAAKHGKESRRGSGTGIGSGGGGGYGYGGGGSGSCCNPCCPPWDGIGTPDSGMDVVNEFAFAGDGFTTTGTTAHPYVPGSLAVWVAGLNVTSHKTEVDPATGAFSLDFAPTAGQTVRVN